MSAQFLAQSLALGEAQRTNSGNTAIITNKHVVQLRSHSSSRKLPSGQSMQQPAGCRAVTQDTFVMGFRTNLVCKETTKFQ